VRADEHDGRGVGGLAGEDPGDEFVALVDPSIADSQTQVSRIAELFSKKFLILSGETEQQVSIGAAVGIPH
jgi:hypothetical protein